MERKRTVCLVRPLKQVGDTTSHVRKGHFAPLDHEGPNR